MQDPSHRLLFLAGTGVMCALAMYASQAGPLFLLDEATAAPGDRVLSVYDLRAIIPASFSAEPSAGERVAEGGAQKPAGTASVVPNGTSCPAANAIALLSPPSVNSAIGKPKPGEITAAQLPTSTGTPLGAGSNCPPARADAGLSATPSLSLDMPSDRLRPHQLAVAGPRP